MENYKVVYKDFGTDSVRGFTTEIEPGYYLIGINTRLSEVDQREALEHEVEHIRRGDFDKDHLNVNEAENEVHRIAE